MRRRDQQCTLPGAVWILADRPDPFPEDSPLRKSRPVRGPVVSVRAIYNTLRWIQGRPCLTCRITQGLGFGPAPRDVDGFPVPARRPLPRRLTTGFGSPLRIPERKRTQVSSSLPGLHRPQESRISNSPTTPSERLPW